MFISIVVPVYNAEHYLEESIKSVLNQKSSDWELILVDDGSTDKSGKICDKYAEMHSNITVIHKSNEGQLLTRLCGVERSCGEYVGFLDADDILAPDYLQTLKNLLVVYDADVICFGYKIFGGECEKEYRNDWIKTPLFCKTSDELNVVYSAITSGNLTGSMWSKVFRRQLMMSDCDLRAFRDVRNGEDCCQSFSLIFNASSVLLTDDILYFYRDNQEGISKRMIDVSPDLFKMTPVFVLIKKLLFEKGTSEDLIDILEARNFNETVYRMLEFYRASSSISRKREMVGYNWSSYLMEGVEANIIFNPYIRRSYLTVWDEFKHRRNVRIYFREKWREIKQKVR